MGTPRGRGGVGTLALAFLLGAAGGFGVARLTPGAGWRPASPELLGGHPTTSTPTRRPARAAVVLPPVAATRAAEPTAADVARVPESPAVTDADVRRHLERAGTGGLPEGTGVITGRILDEDGAPVVGAAVEATLARAWAWWHARGGPAPERATLDAAVRAALDEHRRIQHGHRRATTDAEGRYRLERIVDAAHRVWCRVAGRTVEPIDGHLAARAMPGASVDFVARAATTVPIEVRFPDGTAPEQAWIRDARLGEFHQTIANHCPWTPGTPTLTLRAGSHRLQAAVGGDPQSGDADRADWISDEQAVTVSADTPPAAITFSLRPRRGLSGRILTANGEPPTWPGVYFLRFREGHLPTGARLKRDGRSLRFVHDGEFHLRDIEPGWWAVGVAERQNDDVLVIQAVEVGDGVARVEIRLPDPDPDARLVVRALGPEGRPLRDLSFAVRTVDGGRTTTRGVDTTLEASGRCVLRLGDDDVAALRARASGGGVRVALEVTSRAHGTRSITLDGPRADELVIHFGESATLAVTLTGYVGSPLAGRVLCGLVAVGGDARLAQLALAQANASGVDATGTVQLGPVGPGEHEIGIWLRPVDKRQLGTPLSLARHPVTLRVGPQTLAIPLPQVHVVTVTTEGMAVGTTVSLRLHDGDLSSRMSGQVDASGRVVFEDVPAGTYDCEAHGVVDAERTFTVPDETSIRLAGRHTDALRVTISDPEGPLAKAGFRDHDLIVGLGGAEFASSAAMATALGAVDREREIRWLVIRSGARVEIPTPPGFLETEGGIGGGFEPVERNPRGAR